MIVAFDPGENTGWVAAWISNDFKIEKIIGGTIVRNFNDFDVLKAGFETSNKVITVIYETFHLYPSMSASMAWNSFYPCEVIGVIKFLFGQYEIIGQAPSVKKYSGGLDDIYKQLTGVTEHTKDAYLHLKYYLRTINPRYK